MNSDVPNEMLQQWIYHPNTDDSKIEPSGFYFAVFAFGYFQQEIASGRIRYEDRRKVPLSHLMKRFHQWQLKLALIEVQLVTKMRFGPLPLFEFDPDETIEGWLDDKGPTGTTP
jgi:hypothetical protein